MKLPAASIVIRLLAYPVLAYLTAGIYFYFEQGSLLFPAPRSYEKTSPADRGLKFEDLRVPVDLKDQLHAWWIPAATPSETVILAFHGNAYVLEEMVSDELPALHAIGANLMLVDYRGYGSSTPATPTETTIDEDAEASLAYLLHHRTIPIGNVYLLGRSLGSGPATYLAANHPGLAGLILESPFTSIDEAAARFWYFRIYPANLILRTHLDNLSRIGSVQAPLLIVSGALDTLTPSSMAARLFARARQPKQLYLVPHAGHGDLLDTGGDALMRVLQNFVRPHSAQAPVGATIGIQSRPL